MTTEMSVPKSHPAKHIHEKVGEDWNLSLDEYLENDDVLAEATKHRNATYRSLRRRNTGFPDEFCKKRETEPVRVWSEIWDLTAKRHKLLVEQAAKIGMVGRGVFDYPDLEALYVPHPH
jgi:hypothetical protein